MYDLEKRTTSPILSMKTSKRVTSALVVVDGVNQVPFPFHRAFCVFPGYESHFNGGLFKWKDRIDSNTFGLQKPHQCETNGT